MSRNRSFIPKASIFCAACVDFEYKYEFVAIEDSDLMSIAKGLDIDEDSAKKHADSGKKFLENQDHRITYGASAKTLTNLLMKCNAPEIIEFLSIDVEGNELSVLKGLDFNLYKPLWLLIEVHNSKQIEIYNFLKIKKYKEEVILTENDLYKEVLFKKI